MTSRKPPFRPSKSEIEILPSLPASARRTIPATPRARRGEPHPSGSYSRADAEIELLPEVKGRRRA